MTIRKLRFLPLLLALTLASARAADHPKLTLDEFFDYVDFSGLGLSPDGQALVIATDRADWEQNIFRNDLWLYRDDGRGSGTLTQLTRSGHDSHPQWSPDGRWIAFLSERSTAAGGKSCVEAAKDDRVAQLYVISLSGGEAIPVTQGDEKVHAFAWSSDSSTLYFATRTPWTKAQKEAYEKEWKDTCQYRAAERGDQVFSVSIADAVSRQTAPDSAPGDSEQASDATPGARLMASSPWRIAEMVASPDGRRLAFVTQSISQRLEGTQEFEIYALALAPASGDRQPRQLTRNEAIEESIHWSNDSRHVFFQVDYGSVEGKYRDTQTRLYWVDADSNAVQRWAAGFAGQVADYAVAADGNVLASARLGTEVQVYSESGPADFSKQRGFPGSYETLTAAAHSARIAFVYSSLGTPAEVYLAESADKLTEARPVTAFNKLFTERDLPQGKPYRWKTDDGTPVEGMLMYPPGKFEAKNLPMFVFIHGGPNLADGNHFEADWYVWDRLAATQGWLVFEPNYRGSVGYGDKFLMEMVPEIVSRPGKDILQGVDSLVKDGIADPDHLAVGGYSYGGYMTNWLITQTTRFKAAVTGAGAVENVGNWGNDDLTLDDANDLGGRPWEVPQRYISEAAIFQIDKVRTPTHIVAGGDDIRVAELENYLLDHALHSLRIPSALLIFPGEGHELEQNPWHSKIKVREELKWLQKYGGVAGMTVP
ncbi:MAG TPA: prolyl oligopeptidase family serine peptidase [Terriglobales bacterium]|jgi:dipeptidyl aminopeptidase/acylaminoacyl peptidase|nr:prolyl oligopeptidase family serine peptidase [Terriglobales bacterium]